MNFEGLGFDDALRLFLSSFRLPGEAQKVDRFMQAFSSEYTVSNPKVFKEADSAYVLAFSCIMLNTDAFNTAIKTEKKMTREEFIKNNRDVDVNLTPQFLGAVYDRIVTNEIVMRVDGKSIDSSDQSSIMCYTNPSKHGFLDKRPPSGILSGNSQKRWFVLKDSCLYYLAQPPALGRPPQLKGIIPMEAGLKAAPSEKPATQFVLRNYYPPDQGTRAPVKSSRLDEHKGMVQSSRDEFVLTASSQEERDDWVDAVNEALERVKQQYVQRKVKDEEESNVHNAANTPSDLSEEQMAPEQTDEPHRVTETAAPTPVHTQAQDKHRTVAMVAPEPVESFAAPDDAVVHTEQMHQVAQPAAIESEEILAEADKLEPRDPTGFWASGTEQVERLTPKKADKSKPDPEPRSEAADPQAEPVEPAAEPADPEQTEREPEHKQSIPAGSDLSEPEPEPDSEPDPDPDPEPEPEPEPEHEPQHEQEPDPAPSSHPKVAIYPNPAIMPDRDSDQQLSADSQLEPESDLDSYPKPGLEPKPELPHLPGPHVAQKMDSQQLLPTEAVRKDPRQLSSEAGSAVQHEEHTTVAKAAVKTNPGAQNSLADALPAVGARAQTAGQETVDATVVSDQPSGTAKPVSATTLDQI